MIKLFIKKFIKNYENIDDKNVREGYGILSGVLGLICNAFLFAVKFIIGMLMNSIAIMSDAFNNLSDMGSSVITVISAKLSNKRPDKEHPFGHGRIEYISSFIVAVIIMMVGFELIKTSFDKIKNPENIIISPILIGILAVSVFVKVWMYLYNKYIANKINSSVIKATSADSINDVISTSTVIVSSVLGYFVPAIPIDGIVGMIVSVIIIYSGFSIMKDTVDLLIGSAPDPETVLKLEEKIISAEGIIGTHDLIIHDYGPGRVMASVHAEVPDDADIVKIHEIIDTVEREIMNEMNINMVIHMDPISVNCNKTNDFKSMVKQVIKDYNDKFGIHDFRITDGLNNINLIFDMSVPCDMQQIEIDNAVKEISNLIKEKDIRCSSVIKVDRDFLSQ